MIDQMKRFVNNSEITRFRFYTQITLFILLVYGGVLAIDLGNSLPTFACVFGDKRGGTCYFWALQHGLTISFDQIISWRGFGFLKGLLTFFLLFILFNKAWCGWACPLGTLQDWITKLRQKLKIRSSEYSPKAFQRLKKIKYILLALIILIPLGISNSVAGSPKLSHEFGTPFCMICPGRTLLPLFTGDISQLTVDLSSKTKLVLTALGMGITGLFLVGAFVKKRFICFYCPMSAFHYVFSKASFLGLKKEGSKCTRCGNCYNVCDMGIREIADDVVSKNIVKDDCVMCFNCVAVCPEEGCLEVTMVKGSVYKSTEEGFFKRMERRDKIED